VEDSDSQPELPPELVSGPRFENNPEDESLSVDD